MIVILVLVVAVCAVNLYAACRYGTWLARRCFLADCGEDMYRRVMNRRNIYVPPGNPLPSFWNFLYTWDKRA